MEGLYGRIIMTGAELLEVTGISVVPEARGKGRVSPDRVAIFNKRQRNRAISYI